MFENNYSGDPAQMASLTLAYLGDAVYELYIRLDLLNRGNVKVNDLHRKAVKRVKAETQSKLFEEILPILNEKELGVLKRGRNAKSKHGAKNKDVVDYRRSTGVEALIGYLYLSNEKEKLEEILNKVEDVIAE